MRVHHKVPHQFPPHPNPSPSQSKSKFNSAASPFSNTPLPSPPRRPFHTLGKIYLQTCKHIDREKGGSNDSERRARYQTCMEAWTHLTHSIAENAGGETSSQVTGHESLVAAGDVRWYV